LLPLPGRRKLMMVRRVVDMVPAGIIFAGLPGTMA
jgi:hypothetical protein